MMMKTAGGPGLVSPFDFNERRNKRSARTTWIAIGLVAAAHAAVGVVLYHQRYELTAPAERPEGPPPIVLTFTPPPPKPTVEEPKPAAANPPIHRPVQAPPASVDTVPVVINDNAQPTTGPVISLTQPVENPVDNAPPAAAPNPPPARVITNPSWSRQPNADQMMRAYPTRALNAGRSGSVVLNCLIDASGSVAGCNIVSETPSGDGFGRAAQQLSRFFRINPRTVDGAAEGSRVTIALRFVPPAE
ncbi:hypothetical protein GCM10009422_17370 [Brevundimonas kwangchunensis]|uniref:TonB C-terminal domain-containing protein n=1 Tax=Brevundimonas kwangchunensis TaxID=322163 RepID=A0ABN1GWN2_9CAUL